jgi:hypothetical protein
MTSNSCVHCYTDLNVVSPVAASHASLCRDLNFPRDLYATSACLLIKGDAHRTARLCIRLMCSISLFGKVQGESLRLYCSLASCLWSGSDQLDPPLWRRHVADGMNGVSYYQCYCVVNRQFLLITATSVTCWLITGGLYVDVSCTMILVQTLFTMTKTFKWSGL